MASSLSSSLRPPPLTSTSTSNQNPNPRETLNPSSHLMRCLSFPRLLHHRCFPFSVALAAHEAPKKPKSLLKAKDSVKNLRTLTPHLDPSSTNPTLLQNQAIGMVTAAQANFMRVIIESTGAVPLDSSKVGRELLCVVRALLKKIKRRVMVGDKVLVDSIDWVDKRGVIDDVFGRKTEVMDPPVANVDHLLVLFSMYQPKPEPATLTRFLVEAESTGIPVTLAFNKVELVGDEILSTWKDRLQGWGYNPLFCSVETKSGLAALEDILKGQTTVIVGPSGVGKSSLINSLRSSLLVYDEEGANHFPGHIEGSSKWSGDQRVGTVSERSGKGKHTTRHVSLLPLSGGGYLVDTPGFNQPSLLKVKKKTVAEAFPEIRERISASEPGRCAFNDCLHLGEPGCVVEADWERYPYYLQLLDEIKIREEFQLRTLGTKREGDMRYKVGNMGVKQAEPRLELKKHRRVSRKRINQSILDDLDDDEEDEVSDNEGAP